MDGITIDNEEPIRSFPSRWESKRLLARPYVASDASVLAEVYRTNHDRLRNDFPARIIRVTDVQSADVFIWEQNQLWEKRESFCFGIWDKESRSYAAEVCFKDLHWSIPKADLSYYVVREFEGKGIASAGVRLLLPFAFHFLLLKKLQLRCATTNIRSKRVGESCGFQLEGILRSDAVRADGGPIDLAYYGMTPQDFERIKPEPR